MYTRQLVKLFSILYIPASFSLLPSELNASYTVVIFPWEDVALLICSRSIVAGEQARQAQRDLLTARATPARGTSVLQHNDNYYSYMSHKVPLRTEKRGQVSWFCLGMISRIFPLPGQGHENYSSTSAERIIDIKHAILMSKILANKVRTPNFRAQRKTVNMSNVGEHNALSSIIQSTRLLFSSANCIMHRWACVRFI